MLITNIWIVFFKSLFVSDVKNCRLKPHYFTHKHPAHLQAFLYGAG